MQLRQRHQFTTIRTEGSILPADLLQRINEREAGLAGLKPDDYHLPGNLKLNEAINQSWNRLLGAWTAFRSALVKLPDTDPATTLTREKWLLPVFNELGYGRLLTARAIEFDSRSYPVSHGWQHTPLHLVGAGVDLDKRTAGVAGAARMSPHGLVQELLNRSEAHLWGMVSNGLRLRILRDNVSLTRQAYVEFDLEAMMNGELSPTSCSSGCCVTNRACMPRSRRTAGWRSGQRRHRIRVHGRSNNCVVVLKRPSRRWAEASWRMRRITRW